jgi:hypothetical protein
MGTATPRPTNGAAYASVTGVATFDSNGYKDTDRLNQRAGSTLDKGGNIGWRQNLADTYPETNLAQYNSVTGRNIPKVFWDFLNMQGPVLEAGQARNRTIVDWTFAMGCQSPRPTGCYGRSSRGVLRAERRAQACCSALSKLCQIGRLGAYTERAPAAHEPTSAERMPITQRQFVYKPLCLYSARILPNTNLRYCIEWWVCLVASPRNKPITKAYARGRSRPAPQEMHAIKQI